MTRQFDDQTCRPGRPSSVSCVVPSLNESESLQLLLPALQAVLEKEDIAWEIIVVDDGSSDSTPELMEFWVDQPGIRYLQFSRNFGKEAAITAGLEAADGAAVICLDSDLQHPPELIPEMLARWRDGADMVYAVRAHRQDESPLKRIGSRALYTLLGKGARISIPEDAGDFRLMDRRVVSALLQFPERARFMKGLYAWVGFATSAIE